MSLAACSEAWGVCENAGNSRSKTRGRAMLPTSREVEVNVSVRHMYLYSREVRGVVARLRAECGSLSVHAVALAHTQGDLNKALGHVRNEKQANVQASSMRSRRPTREVTSNLVGQKITKIRYKNITGKLLHQGLLLLHHQLLHQGLLLLHHQLLHQGLFLLHKQLLHQGLLLLHHQLLHQGLLLLHHQLLHQGLLLLHHQLFHQGLLLLHQQLLHQGLLLLHHQLLHQGLLLLHQQLLHQSLLFLHNNRQPFRGLVMGCCCCTC
ncbi:uncharacterized protein LOC133338997 isoform X2 [Lethenteron reissneri]|uniref:uncharacterized protein LOC133338997 isoform X2 n=1 Tax=Lethenteron reissneri TaxID=7753 RepID=UPI002AB7D1F0|nr:uncharacterized protein LOC133338997 isoform X2 [Lethenteron reissneri]